MGARDVSEPSDHDAALPLRVVRVLGATWSVQLTCDHPDRCRAGGAGAGDTGRVDRAGPGRWLQRGSADAGELGTAFT